MRWRVDSCEIKGSVIVTYCLSFILLFYSSNYLKFTVGFTPHRKIMHEEKSFQFLFIAPDFNQKYRLIGETAGHAEVKLVGQHLCTNDGM